MSEEEEAVAYEEPAPEEAPLPAYAPEPAPAYAPAPAYVPVKREAAYTVPLELGDGWLPLEEQARRAAVAEVRDANVAAKNDAALLKMNWAMKAPLNYHNDLAAIRATRTVMTPELIAQRDELEKRRDFRLAARHIFRIADQDGSKCLEKRELERLDIVFNGMRWDPKDMLAMLDTNADGEIFVDEWLAFTSHVYDKHGPGIAYGLLEATLQALFLTGAREEADTIFRMFDRDGNGFLDFGEVSAIFPTPPANTTKRGRRGHSVVGSEAYNFMELVDKDRSGTLDLDEWRRFIMDGWRANPPAAYAFCEYMKAMAAQHGFM